MADVMNDVEALLEQVDEQAVTWDGCDDAIIGVGSRCGQNTVFVYDYDRLVQVFVRDGMTEEEAVDWVDYNIVGAWVGEGTPITFYKR